MQSLWISIIQKKLIKTSLIEINIYIGPYFEKNNIKCGFTAINDLILSKKMFDASKGFEDIYNELLKTDMKKDLAWLHCLMILGVTL